MRGDASADSAAGRIPAAPPSGGGEATDSPNYAGAQAAVLRTSGETLATASTEVPCSSPSSVCLFFIAHILMIPLDDTGTD